MMNIKVIDESYYVSEAIYDSLGNITALIGPRGGCTLYSYDDMGKLVSESTSSGGYIRYGYNDLNLKSQLTNARGQVRNYSYDILGRIISWAGSDNAANYTYDDNGNILTATDNQGTVTREYDELNRISTETNLANNVKMCYTYDADGNMLIAYIDCNSEYFSYDSANRLISAGCSEYTYNVEDVRIRNLCNNTETKFVYNTNARLSQLLVKETAGVITKYVYGLGLIGEETGSDFKIHHYDYRGSTVALTNMLGDVTDTFTYDTYGKLTSRTGVTNTLFMYNGRDGVVTEDNGLIYMRARYYSPELRRFINADIIHGEISNAITLNCYAYANGNPVSNVDPFGLDAILITTDHAAIGNGHTSIIVEDTQDGNWYYFYWGDKAAYFVEVPKEDGALDSFDAFNDWLDDESLPYSTKRYTSATYVEGDFNKSVDYFRELVDDTKIEKWSTFEATTYDKPTTRVEHQSNIDYNLLNANCLQMTMKGFNKGSLNDGTNVISFMDGQLEKTNFATLIPNKAEKAFAKLFSNRSFEKSSALRQILLEVLHGNQYDNYRKESLMYAKTVIEGRK